MAREPLTCQRRSRKALCQAQRGAASSERFDFLCAEQIRQVSSQVTVESFAETINAGQLLGGEPRLTTPKDCAQLVITVESQPMVHAVPVTIRHGQMWSPLRSALFATMSNKVMRRSGGESSWMRVTIRPFWARPSRTCFQPTSGT